MWRNLFLTDFFIFTVHLVNNYLIKNMARSLRYLLIFLFTIGTVNAFAQGPGGIEGTATDENGEPIIGAVIQAISEGGIVKGGGITDIDGNYLIKPLDPGRYTITGKYSGYSLVRINGITVSSGRDAEVKINFKTNTLEEVIVNYEAPLITKDGNVTTRFSREDIKNSPTLDMTKLVASGGGMVTTDRSRTINSAGSRGGNTITMLDGVMIRGAVPNLPSNAIDEIEVQLGGMSAKYGDATGAVVSMNTRGPSAVYAGGLQMEKSVEGFGHNMANFTLSGPLLSKTVKGEKKPVLGFLLNGEAWYDKNRLPSFYDNYVVKDEARERLQQRPLMLSPNTVGTPVYNYSTEFVTMDDLTTVKQMPNAAIFEGRAFAKLDYQLDENITITAGASFNYTKGSALGNGGYYNYIMFSPEAIPVRTDFEGRGYLRFTQRFSKPYNPNDSAVKESRIQNAFYTLQGDYTKNYSNTQDPNHGRNIFNYGYMGRFHQRTESRYLYDVDLNTQTRMWQLVSYDAPTAYTFDRAEVNPIMANYTSQFYQLGGLPPTIAELRGQRGLANGDYPGNVYNLYSNVGNALTGYSYVNNDQVSASANASFDLVLGSGNKKQRHAIEFGLYYQQSTDRNYALRANLGDGNGTNSMWQVMRSLTNTHIGLDTSQPFYRINGQTYTRDQVYSPTNPDGTIIAGVFDTLMYNRMSNGDAQSNFDKNLRAKLGLPVNGTDIIGVDALDPSVFSVDMFSADELLNSLTNPLVSYVGYDYLGNREKGQVNFNDYFTERDANGNYTRAIGAYRPNYIAGYILDRFKFKDINFNIGLRVDRYDLNTKVLKDPYSLYETYKVGDQSTGEFDARGDIPGNMGSDYVVYVDNNASSAPKIIGYRNGDDWYNADGQFIQDPSALRAISGRDPQPYLTEAGKILMTDTTGAGYDPTRSFTDYKPQTTLSPRISFQFPINDQSQFYAHYDILVQRPIGNVNATAYDYMFLTQNGGVLNNPNMKPEKTFDYEFGFTQVLSRTSVISIAGTYKERKDQIQLRPYINAYPITYYSYDNRDYSATKGFKLSYDLRRTANLRMQLNYTLSFVDGTGSSPGSSGGFLTQLIQSQVPNLRVVAPLSFDSRHMVNASVDYRFLEKEGPMVGKAHPFQNMGLNVLFTSRSGTPYTRYAQPVAVANTIKGDINGSRLPWRYLLDLRLDKDFALTYKKATDDDGKVVKGKKQVYVNLYMYINNVLNTRNVTNVDGFTGRPDDDGYLVSPQGLLRQRTQVNPQSFYDLYSVSLRNPNNIDLPRRINFGLSLNF